MTKATEPTRLVAELEALLESERHGIRAADPEMLQAALLRKEALLESVIATRTAIPPEDAARLIAASEQNQRLLEAAAEGTRAALRRLGEIGKIRDGRGTYAADGGRHANDPTPRLTRRV